MKNLSLSIGGIVLLLNIVFGLMLSGYQTFNWVLNSIIICLFIAIQYLASNITLKDGYKYSFYCIFPIISLIELICGFCSPEKIQDNPAVIIILILIVLQITMLILANYLSKNIK